jgi:hypothetical protein
MIDTPINSNSKTIFHTIAIASLTVAILSFVSPQISLLGHGLKTTLPALTLSFLAIVVISRSAFFRAFMRFRVVFILGFLFLIQAALRFSHEIYWPESLWHTFFIAPFLALVFLLWIAAIAEFGDTAVHRLRCWLLFGWCLSIAVSLPILIEHPGVARLTMGNRNELVNMAKWAPYGVGEYTVYTAIAICLGPLFAVTQRMNFLGRWIALLLIFLTFLAVLFSTFTMASVMLMLSFICMLLIWAKAGRGLARMVRVLVILIPLASLPMFYGLSDNYEQTKFIVTKVERLIQGISQKGLAKGDETTRGAMFADEMNSFIKEPLAGYIPGVTGQRGHGHSSFSNSLVLFGLFCAPLWIVALFRVFKTSLADTRESFHRLILMIAWFVLVLSGFLNPIWHSTAALAALFALTLPGRSSQSRNSEKR